MDYQIYLQLSLRKVLRYLLGYLQVGKLGVQPPV